MQGEAEVKWMNGYFMEILQRELVWPKAGRGKSRIPALLIMTITDAFR